MKHTNHAVNGKVFCANLAIGLLLVTTASHAAVPSEQELIDQGRYLAKVAGCNDCHTAGYMAAEGNVPEEQWLLGDRFGWRGPWGTTYAPNLRRLVANLSEEQWITMARTLKSRPPMPWFNLNQAKETDLKALYHYMRHLGAAGDPAPAYVPPDQEPSTPYAFFPAPPQ